MHCNDTLEDIKVVYDVTTATKHESLYEEMNIF
jgi:hypothetical protein